MRTILNECLIAIGNVFGFMAQHALATLTLACMLFCAAFGVLATHSLAGMVIGALCGLPVAFVIIMLLGDEPAPDAAAPRPPVPRSQSGSIAVGVFIILLVSVLANAAQWHALRLAHDKAVQLGEQLRQANNNTQKCNDSITGLETAAFERGKAAEKERAEDEAKAKAHRQQARKILRTPPTQPGNDCGSARDRAFEWLRSRVKP